MKKIIVLANLLLLTACDPFEGVLSVKHPFLVKGKKHVVLNVGDQEAKLEMDGDKQIEIHTRVDGKKVKIELDLPKKLNLPSNGDFAVTPQDLGQDFGSEGNVRTVTSDSDLRSGYEGCTYQRREHYCYPSGPNGGVVCRDEWRTVHGRRMVEYIDRTTDQNLAVSFVHSNGGLLATFAGDRHSVERLYRYQGQCF